MLPLKKSVLRIVMVWAIIFSTIITNAQVTNPPTKTDPDWSKDYKPFQVAGNLYYVGTYDLGCYLIVTPKGHILINTGLAASAPMLKAHIESLGFKFTDIKILLTTQAHFDHVGSMAEIKKLTGATMMADEKDVQVLSDGGNSDFIYGGKGSLFEPVKVDRALRDHDTICLGGMCITMLHHPGHTKGSCSYSFTVKNKNRKYKVLIANIPSVLDETDLAGMPGYPDVAKDYAYTFDAMKKLTFDIWLASHASQFDLHSKRKEGDACNPDVFKDRAAYDAALKRWYEKYLEKLGKK